MRLVLQRVSRASVTVDGAVVGAIEHGLLVLVGVAAGDDQATAARMAAKISGLRIFGDSSGRFDRSLIETGGSALVVSQFTLLADTRRGRRPSFTGAAEPTVAAPIIDALCDALRANGVTVEEGQFGAKMSVELVNDGPVTIILDTDELDRPRREGTGSHGRD